MIKLGRNIFLKFADENFVCFLVVKELNALWTLHPGYANGHKLELEGYTTQPLANVLRILMSEYKLLFIKLLPNDKQYTLMSNLG